MLFDCAIIGGGPAGLNAALVLGRARRNVVVFDNDTNRNRVTQEAHGFLTRDGITPAKFRKLGQTELQRYPSVQVVHTTVLDIIRHAENRFQVVTEERKYIAERVLLATGVQEMLPDVADIENYYGISLHSCPYCDGWERRDQPLIIIAEREKALRHLVQLVYHWSNNLVVTTNGHSLSEQLQRELAQRNIPLFLEPMYCLHGTEGKSAVEFASGERIARVGGFVAPTFYRANAFLERLGCQLKEKGVVDMDALGRTSQPNVYVAGEYAQLSPSALVLAAADGSNAAFAINADISKERWYNMRKLTKGRSTSVP
jgi:thioredoxin reductase